MKKGNKKLNGCGVCGSTSHNRRTYPRKNDVDVLYPAFVVPGSSDHVNGGIRDEFDFVKVLGGRCTSDGGPCCLRPIFCSCSKKAPIHADN
nr:hypothetical protein [Tanacetum cinerariifolium]